MATKKKAATVAQTAPKESENGDLYAAVLNRLNITWEPDEKAAQNIKLAMDEAGDFLRNRAGSPALAFTDGEARALFIVCTFYIISNKLAEFEQEYSGELLALPLQHLEFGRKPNPGAGAEKCALFPAHRRRPPFLRCRAGRAHHRNGYTHPARGLCGRGRVCYHRRPAIPDQQGAAHL